MQHSDEQLQVWCRRLARSDRDAYEAVFRSLHAALYRYAVRLTRDDAAAQDIVQDVFVSLWQMRARLDPSRSLEALLYRMARNQAYNRNRNRQSRSSKHESIHYERATDQALERPDEQFEGQALYDRLYRWIDQLPARQREALLLSRHEGLSHSEIGDVMDISPRTVNNHIVAALKYLREQLETSYQEVPLHRSR